MTSKRKRGRPSKTTKTDSTLLLKAALKAFALHGFEGTNVKQLAAEAGVAPSLFYYHFKDKEGLWRAAIKQEAKPLAAMTRVLETADQQLDKLETLKKRLGVFIQFSAKHPEFHQVITYEMAHQSARADWLLTNILRPLHLNFQQEFQKLERADLIKKLHLPSFISILIGAANIYFNQAYQTKQLYDVDVFEEQEVNKHIDTVIELFFNGILKDG